MFSRKFLARNNVVFTVPIWLTQRQIIIIWNDVTTVVKNLQLVYIKRYTHDVGSLKKSSRLAYPLAYGIGYAVHNVSIVEHDIKEPWNIIILTRWENQTFKECDWYLGRNLSFFLQVKFSLMKKKTTWKSSLNFTPHKKVLCKRNGYNSYYCFTIISVHTYTSVLDYLFNFDRFNFSCLTFILM